MKTKRKSENLCFTVCDVILCFLMVFVSLKDVVDGGMPNDNQKILSRRRRYLTFPEGSSFQVVYETYQPIIGYGNLLIFYLTQALAWELPYSPYYPEEHLQDLWEDVIFPNERYDDELLTNKQVPIVANNNIDQNQFQDKNNADRNSNLNPMYSQNQQRNPMQNQNQQGVPFQKPNEQGAQFQNQNQQGVQFQNQNQQGVQFQNRNGEQKNGTFGNDYYSHNFNPGESNNYYSNNPYPNVPNRYYYSNYQSPQKLSDSIKPITKMVSNKMDYYLSYADKVLNQITNFATQNHNPWKKTDWSYTESEPSYDQQIEAGRRKYAFEQSRHFIHPAFGKRSTDQINTPEEEFNLNYHRTSRQTMYQKIAKFLDTDEINGAECVLKALCETGKRRDTDKKPGPFLMEILRVIFSLPETAKKEAHPVYSQYDHAHSSAMDCDELFPKCKSSLWNKNVILQ